MSPAPPNASREGIVAALHKAHSNRMEDRLMREANRRADRAFATVLGAVA